MHSGHFPPWWDCAASLQICCQSERNKSRHLTGEPETNMSLREETPQKAEMWGGKATRSHNQTSSRGGLTSVCLPATLLQLQHHEGALVQICTRSEQTHQASNRQQRLSNSPATSFAFYKTQTMTQHTQTHTRAQSWTRQPLHWPWPLNSRLLFHLPPDYLFMPGSSSRSLPALHMCSQDSHAPTETCSAVPTRQHS